MHGVSLGDTPLLRKSTRHSLDESTSKASGLPVLIHWER